MCWWWWPRAWCVPPLWVKCCVTVEIDRWEVPEDLAKWYCGGYQKILLVPRCAEEMAKENRGSGHSANWDSPGECLLKWNLCVSELCRKPSWKDGSTAVAVLLVDNTIYIGNLGDSKVCLVHNGQFAECKVLENFQGLWGPRTRTCKLVFEDQFTSSCPCPLPQSTWKFSRTLRPKDKDFI